MFVSYALFARLLKSPKNSPKSAQKQRAGFEQLIIDAGQKDFGVIRCQTCGMVFTSRDPQDEIAHSKFHNMFVNTLRFPVGIPKEFLFYSQDNHCRLIFVIGCDDFPQLRKLLLNANLF